MRQCGVHRPVQEWCQAAVSHRRARVDPDLGCVHDRRRLQPPRLPILRRYAAPPKLRWQRTPCPGCGRPLFPLSAVVPDGDEIWPPDDVPRPPASHVMNATIWFVLTEEDAREGIRVS